MDSIYKYCPACKETMNLDSFGKNSSRKDLKNNYCKKCAVKRRMKYYTPKKETSEYESILKKAGYDEERIKRIMRLNR